MKLLVVGSGVGGSMVARLARQGGWQVNIGAASYPRASDAALCVVRPEWWSGEARRSAQEAVKVYGELGALTASDVEYWRYDRTVPTQRAGFYAVDPTKVLLTPDTEVRWPERAPGYDAVVLCLGAYGPSPGVRSWGVTTIVRHDGPTGLWGRLNRPRDVSFAVNHDGHTTRFGSSVALNEASAYGRQFRSEQQVGDFLPRGARSHISGVRLMPPDTPGVIRHLGGDVWSLDSFGRVGYSVAPGKAREVLAAINKSARSAARA